MRKKSELRTLSNYSKPTKLHPRSAGNVDIEMGRRIRLRRVEVGLSQSELGEKLGVSFQQVQNYEKGVNRVGASRLHQITEALGVDMTFSMRATARRSVRSTACSFSIAVSPSDCCARTLPSKIRWCSVSLFLWLKALWLHRVKQTARPGRPGGGSS